MKTTMGMIKEASQSSYSHVMSQSVNPLNFSFANITMNGTVKAILSTLKVGSSNLEVTNRK